MRISRQGEGLWHQWDGVGLEYPEPQHLTFFTEGQVDLEHETVRKALASRIQRDGLADSLGEAFAALETATTHHGFVGVLPDDVDLLECTAQGETYYGNVVPDPVAATWVEVPGLG